MKALVVGAAIVDQMMVIDRLPLSGEDIPCRETHTMIGGCAFNVASTLANMEVSHDLCVPVGTGMYADLIEAELKVRKYPVLLKNTEQDNGYCLSLVEADGERTFITVTGAEGEFPEEALRKINLSDYDAVYLAGYQAAGKSGEVLADWISDADTQFFFAPGPMITAIERSVMDKFMAAHPVIHINKKEALDYTGKAEVSEALRQIYRETGNIVIVTCGAEGTLFFDGTEEIREGSDPVTVTDTVGAGDSHVGAVIGSLLRGCNLRDAVKNANIVAGGIVQTQGPTMTKEAFDQTIKGDLI